MSLPNPTETRIQLEGVHLCCGGCTDAVVTAVESVPGATCQCDMGNGSVALTARDRITAQNALDAIADAGLHGETGDPDLAMRAQHGIPPGKVKRLIVSDIHNCCDLCNDAIKGAIDTVEGVTGDTARPGRTTFEVAGHFSAAELVRALNAAGFHAKVRA